MERRRLKLLGFILFSTLFFLGQMSGTVEARASQKDKQAPRVILVLVDMSGSANTARDTVYREAFDKVFENIRQGDRVIVGTITGRSYIDFKPAVDVELPKNTIWVNRIKFERDFSETKEKIRSEVDRLLSQKKGTKRTEILNSLDIADTIFHNEKREKILVILSDMIQDSVEYNFTQVRITDKYIGSLIRYRRKNDLLPDLGGVKVYVAGASGTDPNRFRSVEKFWARYFSVSGADFSPHRYGHSLISFEKEP